MSEKFRQIREKYGVLDPGAKDREVSGILETQLNLKFECSEVFLPTWIV